MQPQCKSINIASNIALERQYVLVNRIETDYPETLWMLDSGCTQHISNDLGDFTNYTAFGTPKKAHLAKNGATMDFLGYGNIHVFVIDKGQKKEIILENVLYVPEASHKYISIQALDTKGMHIIYGDGKVKLIIRGSIFAEGRSLMNQYWLKLFILPPSVNAIQYEKNIGIDLWHQRYGHASFRVLEQAKEENVKGFYVDKRIEKSSHPCQSCAEGKQHKYTFKPSKSRANNPLDLVYMDLIGPFRITSVQGNLYAMGIIDDMSSSATVHFLKTKDQALNKFIEYHKWSTTQLNRKLKKIRVDGGTEFVNKKFKAYLVDNGIEREVTVPYSHEQLGRAERWNRTIQEHALAMMKHANLSYGFWECAINTACHIYNRTPVARLDWKTPHELWTGGHIPDVSYFRIFGCLAYVLVPKEKRTKFQPHSTPMTFIGYEAGTKGYKFWDRTSRKIVMSRNAIFDESVFLSKPQTLPQQMGKEQEKYITWSIPLGENHPYKKLPAKRDSTLSPPKPPVPRIIELPNEDNEELELEASQENSSQNDGDDKGKGKATDYEELFEQTQPYPNYESNSDDFNDQPLIRSFTRSNSPLPVDRVTTRNPSPIMSDEGDDIQNVENLVRRSMSPEQENLATIPGSFTNSPVHSERSLE